MELSPAWVRQVAAARLTHVHATPPGSISICTGRTGLRLAFRACICDDADAPILLPSYLCPSLVQAVREEKLPHAYYKVKSDLTIDVRSLMDLLGRRRPRAVLFINYFGFPPDPASAIGLEVCREFCPVIEDATHGSWLEFINPIVGTVGDYVITSLRKYLPVPDGGVLSVCRNRLEPLPPLAPAEHSAVTLRLEGKTLRHATLVQGAPTATAAGEQAYLDRFARAEELIDRQSIMAGMSEVSEKIFNHLDLAEAAGRRRANYSHFLTAFVSDPMLHRLGQPLYNRLPPKVSPLCFPIVVADDRRDALRRELRKRGVFCPVHWSLPEDLSTTEFAPSWELSRQLLSLPIDQRYDTHDMTLLMQRLHDAWRAVR